MAADSGWAVAAVAFGRRDGGPCGRPARWRLSRGRPRDAHPRAGRLAFDSIESPTGNSTLRHRRRRPCCSPPGTTASLLPVSSNTQLNEATHSHPCAEEHDHERIQGRVGHLVHRRPAAPTSDFVGRRRAGLLSDGSGSLGRRQAWRASAIGNGPSQLALWTHRQRIELVPDPKSPGSAERRNSGSPSCSTTTRRLGLRRPAVRQPRRDERGRWRLLRRLATELGGRVVMAAGAGRCQPKHPDVSAALGRAGKGCPPSRDCC